MNTWKVILATVLIFGTGVVTGGLLVRQTHRVKAPGGWVRPGPPNTAGGMRLEFLRRLQRDLELTQDQRERVDRILKDSQERTRKLMEPVSPKIREELQQAKNEFRQVLNARQQARFDELLRQQQQLQQRPRDQRNPPPQRDRNPELPRQR